MLRKLSGFLRQEGILKSSVVFTAHTYRSREDNCAKKVGGGHLACWTPAGLWPAEDTGAVLHTEDLQQRGLHRSADFFCII